MSGDEPDLDHRSRRMIYRYISTHPGVSFGSIKNVLELNSSTLRYHLEYLERSDSIRMSKDNGKRCYHPNNGTSLSFETEHSISELPASQERILEIIKRNPGITKKELVQLARMEPKKVRYNVRRLRENRQIWRVRSGRDTGYEAITPQKLKDEMLKLLLDKYLRDEMDKETFLRLKEELERR